MFKTSDIKKKQGLKCCAYNCNNKPNSKKAGLCHMHYARKIRIDNPKQMRYSQMKVKAKQRNIAFSLTIEQFLLFCKNTGYLGKGKRGQNATVDRRCNAHGYHFFNIQLLTNKQNARKGARFNGAKFDNPNKHHEDLPF